MSEGRTQIVERREVVQVLRTGRTAKRYLSDEEVREIRWWATTDGAHLSQQQQLNVLQEEFPISRQALRDVITYQTHAGITGLPIKARRWTGDSNHLGLILWLALVLWRLRGAALAQTTETAHFSQTG